LPDGWQLKSEVLDEETMVEHCELDPALDATIDYIANTKLPARWRAKALADAVKAETAKRKKR
jgi:hypothetical protein